VPTIHSRSEAEVVLPSPHIGGVVTPGQSAKQVDMVSDSSHFPSPQNGTMAGGGGGGGEGCGLVCSARALGVTLTKLMGEGSNGAEPPFSMSRPPSRASMAQ